MKVLFYLLFSVACVCAQTFTNIANTRIATNASGQPWVLNTWDVNIYRGTNTNTNSTFGAQLLVLEEHFPGISTNYTAAQRAFDTNKPIIRATRDANGKIVYLSTNYVDPVTGKLTTNKPASAALPLHQRKVDFNTNAAIPIQGVKLLEGLMPGITTNIVPSQLYDPETNSPPIGFVSTNGYSQRLPDHINKDNPHYKELLQEWKQTNVFYRTRDMPAGQR